MAVGERFLSKIEFEQFVKNLRSEVVYLQEGVYNAVEDFIDLGDVPGSYVGDSLDWVRVNVGETGLEFFTPVLDDLSDIDIVSPVDGEVLTYIGSLGIWMNLPPAGGAMALDDLTDVNAPAPNDDDVLTWDDIAGEWVAAAIPPGGAHALGDHTDVDIPSGEPDDGDVLTYVLSGGYWTSLPPAGGALALGDLTDVDFPSGEPDIGDVLTYESGGWTSMPPSGGISLLDAETTPLTVSNDSTEQTLYTYTIAANALGASGILRCFIWVPFFNNSGSDRSFILKIKLGATTMYQDTSQVFASNAAWRAAYFTFYLANQDATNSQAMGGFFNVGWIGTAPDTGISPLNVDTQICHGPIGGSAAEDSTGALALTVTLQLSAASANLKWTRYFATLEKLTA